jgi:hypothetical protein
MKLLSLILGGLLIIIVMSSCFKYECDGFPAAEITWIPYTVGDTLRYCNNLDTLSFKVIDHYLTEPSYFRGLVMDYECDYTGYYETERVDLGYKIRESLSDHYKYGGLKISFTNSDFFRFNIWKKDSYNDSVTVKYLQDTLLNGITYYDVFFVSKDTINQTPKIAWLLKAKDKGILGFYDFETKTKWTRINN